MAPVRIRGQAVGIVSRVQRNNANGNNGAALIARLVGKGSHLLVGNADGDFWTDLSAPVAAPAPHPSAQPTEFLNRAGGQTLGFTTPITGTPWVIWMDLPEESSALGAVHHFRRTGILIAVVAALLGTFATLFLVRRVARDVSMQQVAERAALLESKNAELRQREERLRQLVEHSPDAIVVHRDGRIIFANDVAAKVLALDSAESALGRSLFDHLDPAEREDGTARLGEGAGFEEPTSLAEVRLIRADRSKAIVEATAMGVVLDGEPAVQTILRDVTERRLLEDQLRQSQKMEAVGRLAGGIAHDFNNLLTVIHTYADILLSTMALDDPHRADLEEILHAAKSAAGLTRQMLAFSRKQILAPQRVDLSAATKGVIGMIKRIIGDNIEVKTSLREDIAPIWADAGQLEQVLINLAVNARDAMPTGGLLKIETSNVHLEHGNASYHGQAIPPGDYAMLTVADTGVGMPEDVRRQIFEPFFTTKEAGRGTGLGLSTVYGIVKQSEGYIWVYSEPSHGTVFKIYFPRYTGDEDVVNTRIAEPRLRHDRGASILLVEDEPHVRGAVRRVLESRGFVVTEADQPSAALTLFMDPARNFDLVITDMMMPQKTGAELVRDLSERRSGLRAIIMSGYSEEATSRQWRLPPQALFIE
jgi:PAS domain S-box-containing protein